MVPKRSDCQKWILYVQWVHNVIKKTQTNGTFTKDSIHNLGINTAFAPQLRIQAKTRNGLIENNPSYFLRVV